MTRRMTIAVSVLLASVSFASLTAAQQVAQPKSASEVAGTPPGTIMTKDYVAMVGRLAYVWGWPLVNNLNRSLAMANLPEPGRMGGIVPVSPPGYVSMLTDYIDAGERFVACPNQDTVYGAGFQRLDSKPVVVQVPNFGERFFTYQITDARTDSFASIGKQYKTKPGHYLAGWPELEGEGSQRHQRCLPFTDGHRGRLAPDFPRRHA